ncbi:hypothetical protein [Blastococcus sp. SYSU D00820]
MLLGVADGQVRQVASIENAEDAPYGLATGGGFAYLTYETQTNTHELAAVDLATGEVTTEWLCSGEGTFDVLAVAPDGGSVIAAGGCDLPDDFTRLAYLVG